MKNAKQKAIEEAYGEYWEKVKDFVDENGWCNVRKKVNFSDISEKLHWETKTGNQYYWRPKSLQGIEDNNKWISINSEDDLPKEKGSYWVIDKILNVNPNQEFFDPENLVSMKERWMYRITHYQPIIKPEKPIY